MLGEGEKNSWMNLLFESLARWRWVAMHYCSCTQQVGSRIRTALSDVTVLFWREEEEEEIYIYIVWIRLFWHMLMIDLLQKIY